jgi:hypothetical protein
MYQRAVDSTESAIYNDIISHHKFGKLVVESSSQLHIFKSLNSIFYPPGKKGDTLRIPIFHHPASIFIENKRPLDIGFEIIPMGYNPLVMITTHDDKLFSNCKNKTTMDDELELLIRTTVLYPSRSMKYRSLFKKFIRDKNNERIVRQCMTCLFKDLLVFRKGEEKDDQEIPFAYLPVNACRYISVLTVSSATTCQNMDLDIVKSIVRGKLTCVFDVAIKKRENKEGVFDAVVIGDLSCTSPELRNIYCDSISELLPTYIYHFRAILFAIHDAELFEMVTNLFYSPVDYVFVDPYSIDTSPDQEEAYCMPQQQLQEPQETE